MKHFEEQVSQAAARLRNEENSRLRVPRNPRRSGGISWGWVATPVAAVAGLLWGVELGRMSGESSLQQVSHWDAVTVQLNLRSSSLMSRVGNTPRGRA